MSKSSYKILCAAFTFIIVISVILLSCGKNGNDSGFVFEPGEYNGTYSIIQSEGLVDVIYIDTMNFRFTIGGAFYMKLDTAITVGQDRDFCDVTGEYDLSSDQIEIIIDTTEDGGGYIYPQTCDHDEIPADNYNYYGRTGELILDGADSEFSRRIVIWLE